MTTPEPVALPTITAGHQHIVDAAPAHVTALLDGIVRAPTRLHLVARYVHGDGPPNRNGHLFRTTDLERRMTLVPHTPLNMMHRARHIVGTFMRAEMWYPDGTPAPTTDRDAPPYTDTPLIRTLMTVFSYHCTDEARAIRDAHDRGTLFVSQESLPGSVTCPTCDHTAPWRGYVNDGNCTHMNKARAPRWMNDPLFLGGGVVIPPWQPGWDHAYAEALDVVARDNPDLAESVFYQLSAASPHAGQLDIETIAAQLLARAGAVDVAQIDTRILVAPLWDRLVGPYTTIDFDPPPTMRLQLVDRIPELAGEPAAEGWYASDVDQADIDQALRIYRGTPLTPATVRRLTANLPAPATDGTVGRHELLGGQPGIDWLTATAAAMDALDVAAMLANAFDGDDTDAALAAARDGEALPDGTFRIRTPEDLKVAITAAGQTKADLATIKAHLLRRADELGADPELIALIEALDAAA